MEEYTKLLMEQGERIRPEDDNYTEELISVAQMFRNIDEILDRLIAEHGYHGSSSNAKADIKTDTKTDVKTGAKSDTEDKIDFLQMKFAEAGISMDRRNIRSWFYQHKRFQRETAFQICFAFDMNIGETEEFFRRCCLGRGFDCHYIKDAVYYFCFLHSLSYRKAQEILAKAPSDVKGTIDWSGEVLFTGSIVSEIERFADEEELLRYFRNNEKQFGYNNATAGRYIRQIWKKITAENGLAFQEREVLLQEDPAEAENEKLGRNEEEKAALEKTYWQILGLGAEHISVIKEKRSLKSILKGNVLLHPIAEDSFPDRNGFQNVLNGKHTSYESVRKILILLLFYRFWVLLALKRKDGTYRAQAEEGERCCEEINRYLVDAGYPELYYGNPFDWIILFTLQDDFPMLTFREFMNELFLVKEEGMDPDKENT